MEANLLLLMQWKSKDARPWILGSVDPSIMVNLRPYKTAKTMWEYLQKVYTKKNNARRYQLECEIGSYNQGDLSVQDYFSNFQNLWAEYSDMIYPKVLSLSVVQTINEHSKRDQFLMKLLPEFEAVRSNLMSRDPAPSLDDCLAELLREKQRQAQVQHIAPVAYATYGKAKTRDMSNIQCFQCKGCSLFEENLQLLQETRPSYQGMPYTTSKSSSQGVSSCCYYHI